MEKGLETAAAENKLSAKNENRSEDKHDRSQTWQLVFSQVLVFIYFLFLVWRLASLTLYAIFATECFLRAKQASLRCKNFTVFPHPTRFEVAWQMSSSANSVIAVWILFKIPDFPGFKVIALRLVRMARFWSFLCQLAVVIIYNLVLLFHEHLVESAAIELGFILEAVTVFLVVCIWNFVPAPRSQNDSVHCLLPAYYATLIVFFLENFYLFFLMSSQAALDITGIHEFHRRPSTLQALDIVMNATEATFFFAVMKFFWNKLFERGDVSKLLDKETF